MNNCAVSLVLLQMIHYKSVYGYTCNVSIVANLIYFRISQAVEQSYFLALSNFNTPAITAACVCFCELLGVCSLKLRVDLKALNLIFKLWSKNCEENSISSLRQTLGKE